MKKYEVEIMGTTYRTYFINAESEDDAIDKAFEVVDRDGEISRVWKNNAELSFCEATDEELDNLNKDL